MNLAHAIPHDELPLARLTASKLAKIMHGLLSVGTAGLELPSPTDFLAGRAENPLGFVAVLGCVGVNAEAADQTLLLRQEADQLSDLVRQFHHRFLELAAWRTMSPDEVRAAVDRLGNSYAEFCQRLTAFCSLLGMDVDYSAQARDDRSYLDEFFQTMLAEQPT